MRFLSRITDPATSQKFARKAAIVGLLLAGLSGLSLAAEPKPAAVTAAPKLELATAGPVANRPKVPGTLELHFRERRESNPRSGDFKVVESAVAWKTAETAIIICDMWDNHYCQLAAQRVDMMAPRMNEVVTAARNHGVMIIHSPSGTLEHYEGTPYRLRMQQAKESKPPIPLQPWCHLDSTKEPEIPIDVSKSPCDDPVVGPAVKVFDKQHPAIKIIGFDGISDSGPEMYNFLKQEGITNVILMGVHTNMCVLGRPFGIRQMKNLGFNVALCRDLTDAMYDPRQPPYVSHTRGTELVIEHIEKYWCPSVLAADLTKVIPGSADPPSAKDKTTAAK